MHISWHSRPSGPSDLSAEDWYETRGDTIYILYIRALWPFQLTWAEISSELSLVVNFTLSYFFLQNHSVKLKKKSSFRKQLKSWLVTLLKKHPPVLNALFSIVYGKGPWMFKRSRYCDTDYVMFPLRDLYIRLMPGVTWQRGCLLLLDTWSRHCFTEIDLCSLSLPFSYKENEWLRWLTNAVK